MSGVRDQLGLGETPAPPSEEAVGAAVRSAAPDHPHRLLPIDSIVAQCESVLTGLDAMKAQVQGLLIAAVDLRLRTMGGGVAVAERERARMKMREMTTSPPAVAADAPPADRGWTPPHDTATVGYGEADGPERSESNVREEEEVPEPERGPNNHAAPAPRPDRLEEKGSYGGGQNVESSLPIDCLHETIADVSTMGGGKRWHCFDCDSEIEG